MMKLLQEIVRKFHSQARKSTVGKHTLVSNELLTMVIKVMSKIMLIAYNITFWMRVSEIIRDIIPLSTFPMTFSERTVITKSNFDIEALFMTLGQALTTYRYLF